MIVSEKRDGVINVLWCESLRPPEGRRKIHCRKWTRWRHMRFWLIARRRRRPNRGNACSGRDGIVDGTMTWCTLAASTDSSPRSNTRRQDGNFPARIGETCMSDSDQSRTYTTRTLISICGYLSRITLPTLYSRLWFYLATRRNSTSFAPNTSTGNEVFFLPVKRRMWQGLGTVCYLAVISNSLI